MRWSFPRTEVWGLSSLHHHRSDGGVCDTEMLPKCRGIGMMNAPVHEFLMLLCSWEHKQTPRLICCDVCEQAAGHRVLHCGFGRSPLLTSSSSCLKGGAFMEVTAGLLSTLAAVWWLMLWVICTPGLGALQPPVSSAGISVWKQGRLKGYKDKFNWSWNHVIWNFKSSLWSLPELC